MEGLGGQSAGGLAVGPASGQASCRDLPPLSRHTAFAGFCLASHPLLSFSSAGDPLLAPPLSLGSWEAGQHPQAFDSRWPGRGIRARTGSTPRHSQRHGQTRSGRAAWGAARHRCGRRKKLPFTLGPVASWVFVGDALGGLRRSAEVSCRANATSFPDVSSQLSFNLRVPGGWKVVLRINEPTR